MTSWRNQAFRINRRSFLHRLTASGLAVSSIGALAACANQTSTPPRIPTPTPTDDPTLKTALPVRTTDIPNAHDDPVHYGPFAELTARFHHTYPHYRITGNSYNFLPDTFYQRFKEGQAQDLNRVYLTEGQKMIALKYAADVTDKLKQWPYFSSIAPFVIQASSDSNGRIYAIPRDGYQLCLVYRRDFFKDAGLNPDKPPRTWDEFRSAALQLTKKMKLPSYAIQTQERGGGLHFTNWLYSAGGQVEKRDANGTWRCVANSEAGYSVLQMLHDMCWKDGTLDKQPLVNADTTVRRVGTGLAAMYIGSVDALASEPDFFSLAPGTYGAGPMPCTNGANVALAGGDLWTVNPQSSADVQEGATLFSIFSLGLDYYEAQLKAHQANKDVIGYDDPAIFTGPYLQKMHAIAKKYITVPEKVYDSYFTERRNGVAEPPLFPQEWYDRMDTVVQYMLYQKDINIKDTLDAAAAKFQTELLDPYNKTL